MLNRAALVVVIIVVVETAVLAVLVYKKHQEKVVQDYPQGYPYSCGLEVSTKPVPCGVKEDEGKVKVAQRQEVKDLVRQYGRKGVVIRALEFKDVNDQEFMKRLLGANYVEVGCIIYVTYPGGQYVYLEDDRLNVINRLDGSQFNNWLQSASKEDREKFFSHLH